LLDWLPFIVTVAI